MILRRILVTTAALVISAQGAALSQEILDGTEDLPPPAPREATEAEPPALEEEAPSASEGSQLGQLSGPMAMSSSTQEEPVIDWDRRMGAEERLRQYGPDILGDQIDPHTGSISFEHTDVSLPGNSALEVAVRRRRSQGLIYHENVDVEFGDWELLVPRIHALTANGAWSGNRCSNSYFTSFPLANAGAGSLFTNNDYSEGVMMDVPGAGAQQVLENKQGAHWPAAATHVTTEGWWLECTTASDGGQGFIAHAPNGDTYKFDEYIAVQAKSLGVWGSTTLTRTRKILAASEVTDVHGNWVKYDYDSSGRLTKIHSNDTREITLSYSGVSKLISTVTANGRSWQYAYAGSTYTEQMEIGYTTGPGYALRTVTQPDGRQWTLNIDDMTARAGPGTQCAQAPRTLTMTHPYGVTGTFNLSEHVHRQGYTVLAPVMLSCPNDPDIIFNGAPPPVFELARIEAMSVTSKTLSGPNVPSATWTYVYEQDPSAAGTSGSDRTNWTKVTDPAGAHITYFHYWNAEEFGGKLAERQVRESSASGTLLETTTTSYLIEDAVGATFLTGPLPQTTTRPSRVYETATTRGTDWYKSRNGYNRNHSSVNYSHGFPLSTHEWSSTSGEWALRRKTEYVLEHNTTKWLLGQPTEVKRNDVVFDEYDYDSFGRRLWHDRFGVRFKTYTYHTTGVAAGLVKTVKNGVNLTTTFNNYKRGEPQTITRPDSVNIYATIDNNGWMTSETNARGNTTNYQYNNMGWLTLIDPPGTWESTDFFYGNVGTNTYQRATRGTHRTVTWYDGLMRPWKVRTQPLSGGGLTSYVRTEYDIHGRPTFVSFPSELTTPTEGTDTTYDGLGRPYNITENVAPNAQTKIRYLSLNRTRTTDPEGNQTTVTATGYANADDGGVVKIEQPTDITTEITRDIYGKMTEVRQHGAHNGFVVDQTQKYFYDARERLCRHSVPETGDRLVRFDDAYRFKRYATGQPAATGCGTLPAADKVEYTLDDLGRTTFINYPGSTFDITYTYDNNSNLKSAERGTTKWTYNYDGLDQLRLEKLVVDGRSYTTSYDLNTLGALESMTTPGGRFIEFAPNGLGQSDKATIGAVDHASSVDYHPNGSLRDLIYGNGTILTQLLNARQLMDEIKVRDGGTKLVEFTYAYDANGRITSITDGVVAGQNRAFTYDGAGRLLTASGPWGAGSFDYDSLGNIRQKTLGSRVVDIEYNIDNQVSRARDSAVSGGAWFDYIHDARGNVTDNDRLTFTYDRAEQPTSIGGAVTGSFVYDGNYKRAKQVIGGETIYSVYSIAGDILYRDNITTGETTDYVKVAGKTVARIKDDGTTETVSYPHQDHLGSPAAATDSAGNVSWRENYTPYGEERVDDPANDNDENFTGHIRDDDTGLIYAQQRYMDPIIGRFLSGDPVGFSDDKPQYFNRYSYTLNDPVNKLDPDGEFAIPLVYIAAVAITAAFFTADDVVEAALGQSDGTIIGDTVLNGVSHQDGILDGATPGRETKGRTKQYEKPGGIDEANGDFDAEVDPDSVVDRDDGVRTGTTKDGKKINVRPGSSDGRPTVEIQDGKDKTKIRYGDPAPPQEEQADDAAGR